MRLRIYVRPQRVVVTQYVGSIMVLVRVLACKTILVIRILAVDPNACKALIVHLILLVSMQSVSILVKILAVWMPNARSSIIRQCAIVLLVTLETRLSAAIRSQTIVRHRWINCLAPSVEKKTHFHWFILFVFHSKAYLPIPRNDPCRPSPCGLYTECHVIENHPVCSCLSGYLGAPPDCHPECMINAQCPFDRACVNQQCVDPCPGICGLNAMCRAVNHNPICSCMPGYNGDPFDRCVPNPEPSKCLCWKKRDTQFFSFMILKLMLLLSIPFESFETPVEFTIFSILW